MQYKDKSNWTQTELKSEVHWNEFSICPFRIKAYLKQLTTEWWSEQTFHWTGRREEQEGPVEQNKLIRTTF